MTDGIEWTPVPILMYHDVEAAPRPPQYKHFYVLARDLEWQMKTLLRAGYQAVAFGDLSAALRGEAALPPKPFLLTFDDGYANLETFVHPLMRRLGLPYTVFLVSDKIGMTGDWVVPDGYDPSSLLTWRQIRRMQADGGVSFQPHTATHRRLADLAPAEARMELSRGKAVLENELQEPMRVICYPYGSHNDTVVELARECGYAMGVTTEFGRVRSSDDLLRLPRVSVHHVPAFSLTYGFGPANFWWRVRSRRDARLPKVTKKASFP